MENVFYDNIEKHTRENTDFRRVLFTGKGSQLVLMSLEASDELGMETHSENDQFFRFESGVGKAIVAGKEYAIFDGMTVIVPMGTEHNIINTSSTDPLKFYTIYSPPHHKDGTVHHTKEEADASEKESHESTTE
jgi:mannose-6-phosphate isomerase-like protein (cupin superfamily)